MKRPTDKLLKDMSKEELRMESDWHEIQANGLLKEVEQLQSAAVNIGNGQDSEETLRIASLKEAEAADHCRQANLLSSVLVGRMIDLERDDPGRQVIRRKSAGRP